MSDINTEFIFEIRIEVEAPLQMLGATPYGERRIAKIGGGSFQGPEVRGVVRGGGGDWLLGRNDGVTQLDVRLVLETDDGALIYMTYKGLRHGPSDVIARLNAGEKVDPALYYFRTAPMFETASDKYAWLNKCICVATGDRTPDGPVYRVFKVL